MRRLLLPIALLLVLFATTYAQRDAQPPAQPNATADGSGAQPMPQAPKTVETFDFNDLYGSKTKPTQPPADAERS